MNLVANSCIGGYLYRLNSEAFSNPFMWAMLKCNDMIKCINGFNKVNWGNIKLTEDIDNPLPNRHTYNVTVDNEFTIHYTHYLLNHKYNEPTRLGVDVHGSSIYEYVVDKYLSRVRRMINNGTQPVFVILCAEFMRYDFSLSNCVKLINETNTAQYHKILLCNHPSLLDYQSDTVHIFVDEHPANQGKYNTKWFANEYYERIMNIVNSI